MPSSAAMRSPANVTRTASRGWPPIDHDDAHLTVHQGGAGGLRPANELFGYRRARRAPRAASRP